MVKSVWTEKRKKETGGIKDREAVFWPEQVVRRSIIAVCSRQTGRKRRKWGSGIKITEEELELRKARVIHTAFRLFCQSGIDKVTVKEIAKKAGVGEKSVYRYFNTKKELLLETVEMLWKEIVGELSAEIDGEYEQKSGIEQIELLLNGFRNLYENNAAYVLFSYDYKLFLIRHAAMLTEDEYDEVLRPLREIYLRALEKGMADGSIAVRKKQEDVYYAIWGLMRGFVVKIVIYDGMYQGVNPWKERFDIARNLILSGLKNGFCPARDRLEDAAQGK